MGSEPWNPKVEFEGRVRTMEIRTMEIRRRSPKEKSEGGVRGCLRQVLHLSGRPNLGDLHASSGLHQQCNVSIYEYSLHSGVASSQHVRLVFPCPIVFLRFEMFGLGLPLFISSCSVRKFHPGTRWNRARHAMFSTVGFYLACLLLLMYHAVFRTYMLHICFGYACLVVLPREHDV